MTAPEATATLPCAPALAFSEPFGDKAASARESRSNRKGDALAHCWVVNLEEVLLDLARGGERVVTLEIAGKPDAAGKFALFVRRADAAKTLL